MTTTTEYPTHIGPVMTLRGFHVTVSGEHWFTWAPEDPSGLPIHEDETCLAALQRIVDEVPA